MEEHDIDATRVHGEDITKIRRTPTMDGASPDEETSVTSPSFMGDYTLHERLGSGGFAEVYLAEDQRTGRRVALKWLLPEVAYNSELVRRFQSVAERTQALKHPNIIAVYSYEVVEDRAAIVMEYVPGRSLGQILRERGTLPVDEALDVALQLCDALIYAHDNGFIHRDVKPDNVLITPEGKVKLGDFDIAKVTTSSTFTRLGMRIGTPYYMSPEQIRGQPDVDPRSDVFSMGTVLYQMVTGEVPAGHFGHPSELRPDLPRRLGSVILKALARDRGARYATIADLRNALAGTPETRRAQRQPFHFRNRRQPAQSIDDLVELCEKDWESARWHLVEGHFFRWLQVVRPELTHQTAKLLADEPDPDLALERLLHHLDPTLPDPVLAVNPEFEIDLGEMAAEEVRRHTIEVSNPSRGYLVGSAQPDRPWLEVGPTEFRLKEGEALQLTLSARALASLGEHTGQIILESNGGTINVPIGLCTARRLLFPKAGRSAGSVPELVELCNNNRDEATELFYQGAIEGWLEEGPMRFDLVARAQELSRRYDDSADQKDRAKGLRAFLLACDPEKQPATYEPFRFRRGEMANSIPALVELCERHWADAQWHLYGGHFATWLELVEPVLVSEAERIREREGDHDLGLELFLHLLDPERPFPLLEVSPQEVDLGSAAPDERKEFSVTVRNAGRGYLSGRFPWLEGEEAARQYFALGQAFGFIERAGSWYYCQPQGALEEQGEERIRLGHGLKASLDQFVHDPKLVEHLSAMIREKIREIGNERAAQILNEYLNQAQFREPDLIEVELELKELTQKFTPNWLRPEFRGYSFGCLAGESRTFHFVAEIPAELGRHSTAILVESNGGQVNLPVCVQVAPRLLFLQANVSVGSVEELAKVSSEFWGEARALWENGQVREWLHRGLMYFDLVDVADQLRSDSEISTDMQLTQFMLRACPDCQQWLPPCLRAGEDTVNLGVALNQTAPYHFRIGNIGGGDPTSLSVVERPVWLDTRIPAAEPSGVTLELVGNTRSLPKSGLFEGVLALELAGSFGGAELAPQRLTISVRMQVTDSLKVGQWRIPFDGEVQIRKKTVSVRTLWVCQIGLSALLIGVLAGLLMKKALWTIGTWLVLWLVGGVIWAVYGLGYRDPGSMVRDVLKWLKKVAREACRIVKDRMG